MAEIVPCPNCKRQLQIPENYLGQLVQCPDCSHQFEAVAPASAVQSVPPKTSGPAPEAKPRPSEEADEDSGDTRRRRRPMDDEDDFDDVRLSRRRQHLQPHRGAVVLILGILGICCIGAPVTGIIAWILGAMDLKEMDAGRMDPSGRGQTQTGKILGMVSVILLILLMVLYCGFIILAGVGGVLGGPRRRRF